MHFQLIHAYTCGIEFGWLSEIVYRVGLDYLAGRYTLYIIQNRKNIRCSTHQMLTTISFPLACTCTTLAIWCTCVKVWCNKPIKYRHFTAGFIRKCSEVWHCIWIYLFIYLFISFLQSHVWDRAGWLMRGQNEMMTIPLIENCHCYFELKFELFTFVIQCLLNRFHFVNSAMFSRVSDLTVHDGQPRSRLSALTDTRRNYFNFCVANITFFFHIKRHSIHI